ncbi:serine hydrolase [Agrococcus sp. HG114]|uniref:serine hydrolase n=1 Tax=Agrococcus sp. HG114 TaxID=2969757 RepID=UPI00215AA8FA|nr:serine hydrolase [Agrococcus sp. HG114]MCR8669617.1 class A beta-lactamase-related serine hydrolase [Agrococcus sp. HG114]
MTATHPPLTAAATWSVLVRDAATGEVLLERAPEAQLSAASAPKLLLLVACAVLAERGELDLAEPLDRSRVEPVGDSGLWQHLAQQTLAVGDAAMLVGAASDNLATNALLDRIGLDAVGRVAAELGIQGVRLHDRVRDVRRAGDPPRLGTASATGLVDLLARLESRSLGSAAASERVLGWMRHSLDLSMVASAFGLDPLSHGVGDARPAVLNKTGTDAGVRVDAGLVRGRRRVLAYAALANWPAADAAGVAGVLRDMRTIGHAVAAALED